MHTIQDFWRAVKSIMRYAQQMISAGLVDFNLTRAEGNILFQLLAENAAGLSQEELAERMNITKSHISRSVDSLSAKGYVARKRHPGDARVYIVMLTDKANAIACDLQNIYENVYKIIKSGIPEKDFNNLADIFQRIESNLNNNEEDK